MFDHLFAVRRAARRLRFRAFLAVAAALTPSIATAQSYEETVNFLITGDRTASSVSFGDAASVTNETTITAYDQANCTAAITLRQGGAIAMMSLFFSDPQTMQALPKESIDDGETAVVTTATLHFNAVSHWSIQEAVGNYGPYALQVALEGTGDAIMSGTQSVPVTGERPLNCTGKCGYSLPLGVDVNRFGAAMDHLFTQYCEGSYSAF